MNADQKRSNQPVGAQRAFPWRCRHCGKMEVEMTSMPFEGEVRHDGRLYSFAIPKLAIPVCRNCGQKVFTEKVEEQIQAALRAHLHLLTPEEIRFELEQLEMTQKDAADQIGIAEETLSRWLNGVQIQSRAMDNLLRLFFTSQEVRASLATIAGQGIKSRC